MNSKKIKTISLSFFIIVSLVLIIVQLLSGVSITGESEQVESFIPASGAADSLLIHPDSFESEQVESFIPAREAADSLLIHPDSLWKRSEFSNER